MGDTQGARGAVSSRPQVGDDGGAARNWVDGDGGSANVMSESSDQVEMGDDGAVEGKLSIELTGVATGVMVWDNIVWAVVGDRERESRFLTEE